MKIKFRFNQRVTYYGDKVIIRGISIDPTADFPYYIEFPHLYMAEGGIESNWVSGNQLKVGWKKKGKK